MAFEMIARDMVIGKMSRRRWLQSAASFAALALLSNVVGACGGSSSSRAESGTGNDEMTRLTVGCVGDQLVFDQSALRAPAGLPIELTFNNRSNHHQHNWVLVNGGDEEAMAVYEAALAAGLKNDWLPADNAQILVHTPLIASGKSATIRFDAPTQAGDYSYLCTFPGHFLAGMKGTLTIT
jgi:azurin